jgi:hypothetical protein
MLNKNKHMGNRKEIKQEKSNFKLIFNFHESNYLYLVKNGFVTYDQTKHI